MKIICTDGGANQLMEASKLLQLDIRPDEVVGDFDSLSEEAKLFYEGVKFTHSKD